MLWIRPPIFNVSCSLLRRLRTAPSPPDPATATNNWCQENFSILKDAAEQKLKKCSVLASFSRLLQHYTRVSRSKGFSISPRKKSNFICSSVIDDRKTFYNVDGRFTRRTFEGLRENQTASLGTTSSWWRAPVPSSACTSSDLTRLSMPGQL